MIRKQYNVQHFHYVIITYYEMKNENDKILYCIK